MKESKTVKIQKPDFMVSVFLDPYNHRVRVDDYLGNMDKIIEQCEKIAREHVAEKLIFKARKEHFTFLVEKGFRFEACIDGFFLGSDCMFFSKFYTAGRKINANWITEDEIVSKVCELEKGTLTAKPPSDYHLKKLSEKDASQLANLYGAVFEIYPTPMNDPDYIIKTMGEGTVYFGFEHGGKIVSAASAEIDSFYRNAELTDCATLVEHRKYGLMKVLLLRLEEELSERGIFSSYSIARALSFGMNAALRQLGYSYRGRLLNNCYIYDKIENMNMWVKDLSSSANFSAER
ncbi:putative beta-lysine N-acetyltransferase [Mesobacillus zeae]|uniref:Putative beta-lysine N-acetyltransferase n=1 Tax=Mesobacillus zeae TaxID=1917180 RepID=A0A398B5M1_9BACI|nr:putative beta-lysine N-acetyltransferase [Mesobacillus zeae]RID84118.1 putative beta-lysine N-acetyltransferase [Mesobacillus zeae]